MTTPEIQTHVPLGISESHESRHGVSASFGRTRREHFSKILKILFPLFPGSLYLSLKKYLCKFIQYGLF